jgi:hypothetical protein
MHEHVLVPSVGTQHTYPEYVDRIAAIEGAG